MNRIKGLLLTAVLALALCSIAASSFTASLAQEGQNPRNQAKAPGGCYICGTLDYVWVEGADWFGILAEDACPKYLGSDRASPETRRSYCNQVKSKRSVCPQAAGTCDSPNGKYCGDNMPGKGSLYAGTLDGRIYAEPSTNTTVVGSPPIGTRLRYTKTTQVNGQTWYYIEAPGRANGWMSGSQLSCTRPVEPASPKRIIDLKDAHLYNGRAALASAARG